MRLSILDRANTVTGGESDATALQAVVRRAREAEDLGYRRFLVAEHHAVPGLAGSAPAVLAAAVGQSTATIRVGTAGIMVPDHAPLVVAEQAAVLESLFPGRVDIGLGSTPGFTPAVREALRQPSDAAQARTHHLRDVDEVLAYLRGAAAVTLRPAVPEPPEVYLLTGGSDATLTAARERGLGVILGGPAVTGAGSGSGAAPDVGPGGVVSAVVAVADTRDAARDLVLPEVWAQVMSRSTGSFGPLRPVAELDEAELTAQQRRRVDRGLASAVYGTPQEVAGRLADLSVRTGAREVLVTGGMSDRDGQLRSDRLLAGNVP